MQLAPLVTRVTRPSPWRGRLQLAVRCKLLLLLWPWHGVACAISSLFVWLSPPSDQKVRETRRAALVLSELMHSIGTAAKHLFRRIWFLSPSVGAMVGWSTGHACVISAKPQGRQITSDSTSCEHMCGFEPYHTILDAALPKFWHHCDKRPNFGNKMKQTDNEKPDLF